MYFCIKPSWATNPPPPPHLWPPPPPPPHARTPESTHRGVTLGNRTQGAFSLVCLRSIIRTSSGVGAVVTVAALVLVPAVNVQCVPHFLMVQTDGCRRFRRLLLLGDLVCGLRAHRHRRSAAVQPTRRRRSALFALPAVVLSALPACTLSARVAGQPEFRCAAVAPRSDVGSIVLVLICIGLCVFC